MLPPTNTTIVLALILIKPVIAFIIEFHGSFSFSFGKLNEEGKSIIDFSMAYDFKIANTYFKKREEHLITYKSGVASS